VFPKFVFFGVAFLWSTVAVVAQNAPAAPPIDPAALLKELLTLQNTQKQSKVGQLSQLAKMFQDASRTDGDAGRLYVDSVKTTDFSSQMGDAKRMQDWRGRSKDLLDNKAFQAALRFHLRYLALTLTADANAKAGTPPPYQDIVAYVSDLAQARTVLNSGGDQQAIRELLERPISEGKIAKAQGIKPDLEQFTNGGKTWAAEAGNWPQILEVDVRAPMRLAKNPKLLDVWQFQMKLAGDQLAGGRDENGKVNFTQVEVPRMMWGEAQDMALLGHTNEAIGLMVKLVKGYPQHPDFQNWIGQLTGMLQEMQSPAAKAPAAGGS
jgi:hypothetical protein